MTFRGCDRAAYLLAFGILWSSCGLNALAIRGPLPSGESKNGSPPQSVSVEDLERILAKVRRKPDANVARQLSDLELTERMSSAQLKSLEQSVPGAKSRWALVALADASVFLSPAAEDVLSQAPPDLEQQCGIVALTMNYLDKTLPKLPDFYATRVTARYQGEVQTVTGAWAKADDGSSWREVGSSRVVVVYRDGQEVVDPREWGEHPSDAEGNGMITRGTFGPILSTVVLDAAHGEMTWDRWERGSTGALAVFRYSVPEEQSHYSVTFQRLSSDRRDAEPVTGYHGELSIDPATGTILRLTVQAYLPLSSPILRGDVMVEYGPVEIGGKTYTCPIRSVSISRNATGWMGGADPFGPHARTAESVLLNDVTFVNYRLFRSDFRILTGNVPAPP